MLRLQPIAISPELAAMLKRALITANLEYKGESGNNWSCLTSNNLVSAVGSVESKVAEINVSGVATLPKDQARQAKIITAYLARKRAECITTIKKWFEANYDSLLYDMSGKIPWAIVQRLRRNLGMWIVGSTNPFTQDIEEMIIDVAAENSIISDDAEEAWEAMGGKLFDQK